MRLGASVRKRRAFIVALSLGASLPRCVQSDVKKEDKGTAYSPRYYSQCAYTTKYQRFVILCCLYFAELLRFKRSTWKMMTRSNKQHRNEESQNATSRQFSDKKKHFSALRVPKEASRAPLRSKYLTACGR